MAAARTELERDDGPRGGRNVLVVDDDLDFAEGLDRTLSTEGYTVALAHSSAGAIEAIGRFTPDVALIDIRLAGHSGIDLIAKLREVYPEILCLMITAYASTDTAVRALHEGAYDYLTKPIHGADLLATLDRCFERISLTKRNIAVEATLRTRNRELEQINSRLQLVVDSMRGLACYATVRDLCPRILEEVARNMAAEGGSVYLREGDHLVLRHSLDPGHAPERIPLPPADDSVFGNVLRNARPVLVTRINKQLDLLPSGWKGYRDSSLLVFPLLGEDGTFFGVLSLHAKNDPPFTNQDREIGLILISCVCETIRAVRALENLTASEERHRSLVEHSAVSIHEMDLSGRLLSMNRAGLAMFGAKTEADMIGTPFLDFVRVEDVEQVRGALEDLRQGAGRTLDFTIDKKGEIRVLAACIAPLFGSDGAVQKIIGIIQDFTGQRKVEERLRQAQRMEAVGELTGGIAHDFNNLLAIMIGNAQLLADRTGEDEEAKECIEEIKAAIARGSSLTGRLLAFSRKTTLAPVATDVSDLIGSLHDMLQRTLGETVELKVIGTADLWSAMIDPQQFENALVNLTINARDAMLNGGTLTIETANVTLDKTYAEKFEEVTPGEYINVAVSDTGTGMTPEVLEKVFDPFFTTKEVGKGSGLGLSMVYGFVKQSKGHITIYSEVDHGTTVKLYMPRSQEGAAKIDTEDEALDDARGSERILVVEDDPSVRKVPVKILRGHGYQVAEAGSGEEAIDQLKTGQAFDLLFTDVVLPGGMNGVEIAAEAKRLHPDIKVLYTTGYAQNAVIHNGQLDPGVTLVNKPFLRAELLEKVRTMLDSEDE